MNLKALRVYFESQLHNVYEKNEIQSFFYRLTAQHLDLSRVDVALALDREISEEHIVAFEEAIGRLQQQEPIQYIQGETLFYGLTFKVNPNVLIPRPETEELVHWILETYTSHKPLNILDIGTGSGCIAITLAKHLPQAQVYALDISQKALTVAKENAETHEVALQWLENNILEMDTLPTRFDIIVSNPPYVRELEKEEMEANVLDNEPHLALFVSDTNPLLFYKKITKLAQQYLHSEGALYVEINQYLGEETVTMMKNEGFTSVTLKKDLYQNDRMIRAIR